MKRDTKRRIELYQSYLPHVKERLAGAALMFLIAAIMMTSATFAWVTLSASPEVSSIKTTLAANGTLEIALVQGDGSTYPTSGRGDSSASDNNIVRSNVTWGNLVNLSDASYGINNIALRPALLHEDDLINRPLRGAVYGTDGRISALDTNYTFAKWDGYEFLASTEKGVRAISAYKLAVSESSAAAVQTAINRAQQRVSMAMSDVNNKYKNECWSTSNINGLKSVLTAVIKGKVQDKLNGTTGTAEATDITDDIPKIYNLYKEFYESMELQKTVFVEIANFQRYINALANGENTYNEITWEELSRDKAKYNRANKDANSTDGVIKLTGLTQFISDYNQVSKDHTSLKTMNDNKENNGATYTFGDIYSIMSRLVGLSALTVNDKTTSQLGTSDAFGLGNNAKIVLNSGYIFNMEQLAIMSGYRVNITMTLQVSLPLIGDMKNCNLKTSAATPCYAETDLSQTSSQSFDLVPGDKVATDNYGLAIDFWVRTNAERGYLVLEGKVEKETQTVREVGTDGDGNKVDLYIATVNGKNIDVYKKGDKYYKNQTNDEVTPTGTPKEKFKTVEPVVGFEGENRVWDDENGGPLLTIESTTQGSGSCYVFYADSPEEQTKFLKLLEAFNVAFVSQNGDLLAKATMDVENAYALNGKVTVPLTIKDPTTIEVVEKVEDEDGVEQEVVVKTEVLDEDGNPIHGITELERNRTMMVTALVYIDGTLLGNDDVLAASSIQGQLNLQFGSSTALYPTGDIDLESKERVISATIDKTSFDYAVDDDISVNVTLNVQGDSPANVSAFFQRAINNTQGKRMQTETFSRVGDEWKMHYTFNAPGEYYLREVILDGINYELKTPLKVTVTGFAPEYVFWGEASDDATIYTASSKYIEEVGVSFGSGGFVTQTDNVVMEFEGDNGNFVSAKMSYDYMQARWTGKAEFGISSTYTLKYVYVNGEPYDLSQYNKNFVKRLTLYMGLTAEVSTSSAQRDFFEAGHTYPKDVKVQIYDNANNIMEGLKDAVLTYSRGGSATNTVSAPLTWDVNKNAYTGVLSITRAGSYSFLYITIGENRITRAISSPTFTIKNPDPVSYNTSSSSTYHGEDNIQFVPLANNAYIGPIRINNSDTAFIEAVVTNSVTGKEYTIVQSTEINKRGVIYYEAGAWYINLPTYTVEQADGTFSAPSQDGTWIVKSISLWDVMDTNNVEHTESNKLVWTHGVGGYDFSALSTTVSGTINVVMTPGTVNLGSSSSPFMAKHSLAAESGMYITITDSTGRVIPKSVIKDITLNLSYTGNNDMSYGYKVSSEYRPSLYVKFSQSNENTGVWTATVDPKLQYVGVYTVKNLVIAFNNITQTLSPESNGIPAQYTLTSAGPESSIKYEVRVGDNSALGKTNGVVTGMFLQPQTPDIRVITRVTYTDENGAEQTAQYAIIENFGVQLHFTYKDGKTAPNGGGYTWTSSEYESFDLNLTKAETTTNGEVYKAPSTTLLAGTYSVTGSISMNGSKTPIDYTFPDVTAYSTKPTVKVSGVEPSNSTSITLFLPGASNGNYADYDWDAGHKETVKNSYKDFSANLYMSAERNSVESAANTASFTVPKLTLSVSNLGSSYTNATATVGTVKYTFSPSASSVTQSIGSVETKSETLAEGGTCGEDATVSYQVPTLLGTKSFSTISITSGGSTYTVPISNTVTIRQTNEIPPSISFEKVVGYTIPETKYSDDGQAFQYVLPTDIGTKTETKVEAIGNDEWILSSGYPQTKKLTYAKSSVCTEGSTGGCSPKTTYTYERTYALYDRITNVYTQTTSTNTYSVTYHLIGWIVDGTNYTPGQTITVNGQFVATPIFGEKSKTLVSSETKSGTKTVEIDVYTGETKTTGETSENKTTASQSYVLPSGYTWFDSTNKDQPGDMHDTEKVTEVWK